MVVGDQNLNAIKINLVLTPLRGSAANGVGKWRFSSVIERHGNDKYNVR